MKEYLSSFSAAEMWDIPYLESVLGFKISDADSVHITVSEHSARFSSNGKRVHSCVLDLPAAAIITRERQRSFVAGIAVS